MRPVLLLLLAGLSGCAHTTVAYENDDDQPRYRVAVLDFSFSAEESTGDSAEDGCVDEVIRMGFRAVERRVLDAILQEKNLSRDGEVNPRDYQGLGKMLGADILIIGSMGSISTRKARTSARAVSAKSGEILAVSNMRGRIDKGFKVGRKICHELLSQIE